MTVELGSVYCYQRSGTKSRLIEKKETFQYVPLIENLQSVLQNKDIYSEVSQPIVKFLPLALWFMCGKTVVTCRLQIKFCNREATLQLKIYETKRSMTFRCTHA